MNRYHRQSLLPQIGLAGQERLAQSRVVVIGCGALGTVSADYLARAGVGHLAIVDRDIVEETNLQRQTLFDEADARDGLPKAVAAAGRLKRANSTIEIEPIVADVNQDNIEELLGLRGDRLRADLVVDGTDNAETRYLVNDVAVKHQLPWIYGAAVGVEGRVMAIAPPLTACLRCIFPQAPSLGELATCDTTGVLGPVAGAVASLQAAAALRWLVGDGTADELVTIDAWTLQMRSIGIEDASRSDCPCCGSKQFEFLDAPASNGIVLCGRDSVQLRPAGKQRVDLAKIAQRLELTGRVERTAYLVRYAPSDAEGHRLTIFIDGRTLVHGVKDATQARTIAARALGW
jgi:adenylyltransferase/sulfurtransferase